MDNKQKPGISGRDMVLVIPFLKPAGLAVYPFIFINDKALKQDEVLLRHERIHLRQQVELLLLPFYLLYILFYLRNLFRYRQHQAAYEHIPFEREAYAREAETDYLHRRHFWAWRNYQ